MSVVRPLVVMAHGEPRFFCSCGSEMHPAYGRRFRDGAHEMVGGVISPEFVTSELLWFSCDGCGSITQEIEVGAVASPEHAA